MDAPQLNVIEKAPKPTNKLIKIRRKDKKTGQITEKPWLPAYDAIDWFWADFPAPRGRILPLVIDLEKKFVRAEIYVDGQLIAAADVIGEADSTIEKLQTGAVRRALAFAGYGTTAAIGAESRGEDISGQARAAMASKKLTDDGVDVRKKLGSGVTRKVDTSKGAPATPFDGEWTDRYADLRAAIDETSYRVKDIQERDVPGTAHVVLTKSVNDATKFAEWLKEKFGADKIINVGGSWFDVRWQASPTPGGEG